MYVCGLEGNFVEFLLSYIYTVSRGQALVSKLSRSAFTCWAASLAPSLNLPVSLLFLDLSYTGILYPDLLVCLEGLAICPSKNKYQFILVKWAEELEYEARIDSTEHVSGPSLQQRHKEGRWGSPTWLWHDRSSFCVCADDISRANTAEWRF